MTSVITQRALLARTWQPLVQSVRFRRVNVQRPRPPHYERALLEALVKPTYPSPVEKLLPLSRKCLKKEEQDIREFKIDNPFENILAKNLLELFNQSRMIAICQMNIIKAEDKFNMIIKFKREKMTITQRGKHTIKLAVQNTKYEPILQLFSVHQVVICSPEPNVGALLKLIKRTPELILLAGIVDDYFASVSQLTEYARLKDITAARAQLVSVLNSAGQGVVSSLNQHQSILVGQLDQYVSMQQEKDKTEMNDASTNAENKAEVQPQTSDPPTSPESS